MKRLNIFAIACLISIGVLHAANPSFNSFNPNQFDVTGNRVAITNTAIITNLFVGDRLTVTNSAGTENALELGDPEGDPFINLVSSPITGNLVRLSSTDTTNVYNKLEFWTGDRYLAIYGYNNSPATPNDNFFTIEPYNQDGLPAPYYFSTPEPVGSGYLFKVDNNGTNKFAVKWDGTIEGQETIAANSLTITNQLDVHGSIKANILIVTNSVSFYSNTFVSNFFATSATITNNLTVQGDYIGTIDPTASGTTLKVQKSLKLQFPRLVDNAGCTYSNTNDYTALTFMLPQFSGTGATNANYCDFAFRVPADLDTSKDLTASLTIRLTNTDTSGHTYDAGMVSIANSGAAAGTPANFVALTISGDGSGASGDIESVSNVTLTSWRSNMTAGQWCLLRLNRDGANDASTAASNLMELEIFYWATQ